MTRKFLLIPAACAIALALVVTGSQRFAQAEGSGTQAQHTVSQPGNDGTDKITIKWKDEGGETHEETVDVDVKASDTPDEKATKYAAALDGITGIESGASSDTVTMGTTNATSEITKVKYEKGSKQKKKKIETFSLIYVTTAEVVIEGTATAVSFDPFPAVVRCGTARGVAEVATTPGMDADDIRDALLADLVVLGISATASGLSGIEIQMQPLDGNLIEWGESDLGISTTATVNFAAQ